MDGRRQASVNLRDVRESDLPVFYEHQRDPVAAEMADFPSRDRTTFMNHWKRLLDDDTIITRTILVDGQVAGNIVSFVHSNKREVGYWLGREFWNRGVATRALAAFLDQETTRPLYAHVATHNVASIRVLEKCGFQVVREQRKLMMLKLDNAAERTLTS